MVEPITATYVQESDADWTITVNCLGEKRTSRAPGIIAARDRADQLVEKLTKDRDGVTVVHLLNGSALDFTATYMQARLARTPQPDPTDTGDVEKAEAEPGAPAEAKKAPAKPKRAKPSSRRTVKRTTGSRNGKAKAEDVGGSKVNSTLDAVEEAATGSG